MLPCRVQQQSRASRACPGAHLFRHHLVNVSDLHAERHLSDRCKDEDTAWTAALGRQMCARLWHSEAERINHIHQAVLEHRHGAVPAPARLSGASAPSWACIRACRLHFTSSERQARRSALDAGTGAHTVLVIAGVACHKDNHSTPSLVKGFDNLFAMVRH